MTFRSRKKRLPKRKSAVLAAISEYRFLPFTVLVLAAFLFCGKCSQNEYSRRSSAEISYLKSLKNRYGAPSRKLNAAETRKVIAEACSFLAMAEPWQPVWDTPDARDLLFGTAAAESNLIPRFQDGGGDAIGLFQVEYGTYRDLWRRAVPTRHPAVYAAMRARFGDIKFGDLQTDDVLCAVFARLKYFCGGGAIPDMSDVDAQAHHYKKVYNTAGGAANVDIFKNSKERVQKSR